MTASLPDPWPIEQALPAALEASWNQGLGGLVMAALQNPRDRTANR